jgi:NADH-quinone oxidoreductase subunit J
MTSILFYLFSAILLFAGFRVITAKNAVHASMFLILAFFTTAAFS